MMYLCLEALQQRKVNTPSCDHAQKDFWVEALYVYLMYQDQIAVT